MTILLNNVLGTGIINTDQLDIHHREITYQVKRMFQLTQLKYIVGIK
jgi:hypothetical protein